jgi:DNA-binding FrmR family transcriptional regulator
MDVETQRELLRRLKRAEGQVGAVGRMVEEGEDCVDVLLQISAVRGALAKVAQALLESHLQTCVRGAFASRNAAKSERQLEELVDLFGRYGGIAAR